MATIDELVLVLGLDPTKFTEGQRVAISALRQLEQQSQKSGKEVESQSKKLLDFFSNIKREALGFLGAFYGGKGIAEVVQHMATLDATVGRAARNFGVSTPFLAKWISVLRQTGGSAEDATAAVQSLSEKVAQFAFNPASVDPGFIGALTRIGVKPEDYTKPDKIIEAFARYAQSPAGQRDIPNTRQLGFQLGLNPNFLTAAVDTRLATFLKNAEAIASIGDKQAEAAQKLVEDMSLLEQASEKFANAVGTYLIPTIEAITKTIEDFLGGKISAVEALFGEAQPVKIDKGSIADRFLNWLGIKRPSWLGTTTEEPATPPPAPTAKPTSGARPTSTIADLVGPNVSGYDVDQGYGFNAKFPAISGAGAAALVNHNSFINRARSSHVNTHIGHLHIHTAATDAHGISKSIVGAVKGSFSSGANSGLV